MGNSSDLSFGNYQWEFVNRLNTYEIVRDKRTGLTAEKHIIANNPTISEQDELAVYNYRNRVNKPIVKVYDAQYTPSANGACGAANNIIVHSEYIPYRLSNTKNMNYGQALYVLSESLAGFHELHHRFGPFEVTDDHIGFNEIGQVKVWNSPNFATNRLERDCIVLMSTTNPKNFDRRMEERQEQEMVEDIWLAVSEHANISEDFSQRVNYFRSINFVDARVLVEQEIAKGQVYVPYHLKFNEAAVNNSDVRKNETPSRMMSEYQEQRTY